MASELMNACVKKDIIKLKTLLESSKNRKSINDVYTWSTVDTRKSSVLSYACFSNTHDFVDILLEKGARDDIEDTDGDFPIHHACLSDLDVLAKVKILFG